MGKGARNRAKRQAAELSLRDQRRAMVSMIDAEVNKAVIQRDKEYIQANQEALMVVLHDRFDFTPAQLKQFFIEFDKYHHELIQRYELGGIDEWLCHRKLQELGIDLDTNTWPEDAT